MISTTLNIHIDVLSKITDAAKHLDTSRKAVIVLLLKRMMKNHRFFTQSFSTVKYQQDDDKDNWHCFHIRFRPDENEFFVDLRKVCKFSVSCLLAMAVKQFLSELMRDIKKKLVDNYQDFKNYVLHKEIVEGILSWQIYWGLPMEHLKTLRL